METCEGCGRELEENEVETCPECFATLCSFCMDDHEMTDHCAECGTSLDLDPPCPICGVPLCDDCLDEHTSICKQKKELQTLMEKQQQRITNYL